MQLLRIESPGGGGGGVGGGEVLPKKLDSGVRPAYQNPYPIYDLTINLIPYLSPDSVWLASVQNPRQPSA